PSDTWSPAAGVSPKIETGVPYWLTRPNPAEGWARPSAVTTGLPRPLLTPPKRSAVAPALPAARVNLLDQSPALSERSNVAGEVTKGSVWNWKTFAPPVYGVTVGNVPDAPRV